MHYTKSYSSFSNNKKKKCYTNFRKETGLIYLACWATLLAAAGAHAAINSDQKSICK
jgi:hypothetical protein